MRFSATFALPEPSLREVSVEPSKLSARTDWLFTFQDLTVQPRSPSGGSSSAPLRRGGIEQRAAKRASRSRLPAAMSCASGRSCTFPRHGNAAQRGRDTVFRIIGLLSLVLAGSALVAAAGAGLVAWSRHEFAPRVLLHAVCGLRRVCRLAARSTAGHATLATFSTAQPFSLQVLTRVGVGVVGLLMPAAIVALAAGTLPFDMPVRRIIPRSTAALLGSSLGLIVVAAGALSHRGSEPPWPDVSARTVATSRSLAAAAGTLPAFLLRSVTMMVMLSTVDHVTHGWTRRRLLMGSALILVGAVLGAPGADSLDAWMMTAALSGAGLLCAYVFLLRHDVSLTPFVIATLVRPRRSARRVSERVDRDRRWLGARHRAGRAGRLVAVWPDAARASGRRRRPRRHDRPPDPTAVRLNWLTLHWERLARRDPFFAVLTDVNKRFGADTMSTRSIRAASTEIAAVLQRADERGIAVPRRRALDFGCGVGRLTLALAEDSTAATAWTSRRRCWPSARQQCRHPERCAFHRQRADDLALFDDASFTLHLLDAGAAAHGAAAEHDLYPRAVACSPRTGCSSSSCPSHRPREADRPTTFAAR